MIQTIRPVLRLHRFLHHRRLRTRRLLRRWRGRLREGLFFEAGLGQGEMRLGLNIGKITQKSWIYMGSDGDL